MKILGNRTKQTRKSTKKDNFRNFILKNLDLKNPFDYICIEMIRI